MFKRQTQKLRISRSRFPSSDYNRNFLILSMGKNYNKLPIAIKYGCLKVVNGH